MRAGQVRIQLAAARKRTKRTGRPQTKEHTKNARPSTHDDHTKRRPGSFDTKAQKSGRFKRQNRKRGTKRESIGEKAHRIMLGVGRALIYIYGGRLFRGLRPMRIRPGKPLPPNIA